MPGRTKCTVADPFDLPIRLNSTWPELCRIKGTRPNSGLSRKRFSGSKHIVHLCFESHLRLTKCGVLPDITKASIHVGVSPIVTGKMTAKFAFFGPPSPPNLKVCSLSTISGSLCSPAAASACAVFAAAVPPMQSSAAPQSTMAMPSGIDSITVIKFMAGISSATHCSNCLAGASAKFIQFHAPTPLPSAK